LISEAEELRRLIPALKLLRNTFPKVFISVDTFRSSVALAAAELGADMINDITGGEFDKKMFSVMGKTKLPYIIMHSKGEPKTMQKNPHYKNVVKEVNEFFEKKIKLAKKHKITQLIIDPGFGFGKTTEHNYELLRHLKKFSSHEIPILIGVSRKGMVYKPLDLVAEDALNGTTVINTLALANGASILRVHDVKEAKEAIKLLQCYLVG